MMPRGEAPQWSQGQWSQAQWSQAQGWQAQRTDQPGGGFQARAGDTVPGFEMPDLQDPRYRPPGLQDRPPGRPLARQRRPGRRWARALRRILATLLALVVLGVAAFCALLIATPSV